MKRRDKTVLLGTAGLVAAGLLALLGIVMSSNASFARTYVRDQLGHQRITFPAKDALTEEERHSACLVRYAGQQLTTGNQAECYANDFIALHLKEVAGGQTYAQLGQPAVGITSDTVLPVLPASVERSGPSPHPARGRGQMAPPSPCTADQPGSPSAPVGRWPRPRTG